MAWVTWPQNRLGIEEVRSGGAQGRRPELNRTWSMGGSSIAGLYEMGIRSSSPWVTQDWDGWMDQNLQGWAQDFTLNKLPGILMHTEVLWFLKNALKKFISLVVLSLLWHAESLVAGMQDFYLWCVNSQLPHVGSSSLTRDQTQAPCIGSVAS